jgi:hypothetical protein
MSASVKVKNPVIKNGKEKLAFTAKGFPDGNAWASTIHKMFCVILPCVGIVRWILFLNWLTPLTEFSFVYLLPIILMLISPETMSVILS